MGSGYNNAWGNSRRSAWEFAGTLAVWVFGTFLNVMGPGWARYCGRSVAYYQLIESAREWPIDAANVLRFIGYLLLGLGSWLGGAVVERILDTALQG